ncbi:hypothetical protein GNX18_17610 [Microbulbifer sp. SH-1]|uniref:hypothetical protein n=1 Tax=Microbulbifer sp. SH-1 TaxID=2681547 RepID=UPI00140CBF14|nr:hypothetical protein [Microbulbifer sp. SH-1]QIL91395.1 hypothetical protein GNX18_17610 [Microbulbifer sp. SH-1]
MSEVIPVLAAGKELRFSGGQYGGIFSVVGKGKSIHANYEYKSPLRFKKKGRDQSLLNVTYMQQMTSRNSAAHDLSDAVKGRNNTVFAQMVKNLSAINRSLNTISKSISANDDQAIT